MIRQDYLHAVEIIGRLARSGDLSIRCHYYMLSAITDRMTDDEIDTMGREADRRLNRIGQIPINPAATAATAAAMQHVNRAADEDYDLRHPQ